jgi:hypothetical protein
MAPFTSIPEALEYVVHKLTPQRHRFVLTLRGRAEPLAQTASPPLFVDEDRIFQNGRFGLALVLPFGADPERLALFQRLKERNLFTDVSPEGGDPCFAAFVGTDVQLALRLISAVLANVYACPELAAVAGELQDEGVAPPAPAMRIAGLHKGAYRVANGFDDPLPDDFWAGAP